MFMFQTDMYNNGRFENADPAAVNECITINNYLSTKNAAI